MSTATRIVASLGSVALFAACGFALTVFVPSLRAKPFARRLAWAYLLGLAYVGVSLYALSHWGGIDLRRGTVLAVSAVPIALAVWRGHLFRSDRERPRVRASIQRAASAVAVGAGALVSVAVLSHAVSGVESGFDSRMTWNPAAVYVRAAHTVDAPALRDASVYVQHPRYPLLLPVLQAASEEVFGTDNDERIPRPLYAVLLPVLLLLVFDVAQPFAGTLAAALTALAITLLPGIVFNMGGGAISSYSDLPMGLLWGGGLVLVFRAPWRLPETLAGGLLLGGAALTKLEGSLLAGVVVAIACLRAARRLIARRRRGFSLRPAAVRATGGVLAIFLVAAALHVSWRAGVPERYSETWDDVTLRGLVSGTAARLPVALPLIGREMAKAETWGAFWWLVPVIFVLGARAFTHPLARLLTYSIVAALCVYFAAYGTTSWGLAELVPRTWNRFLIQLSLPVFVLFAMALGRSLRGFRRSAVA